jgi:hypothetical protein
MWAGTNRTALAIPFAQKVFWVRNPVKRAGFGRTAPFWTDLVRDLAKNVGEGPQKYFTTPPILSQWIAVRQT